MTKKLEDIIIRIIMKRGGLSDFDREYVEGDAKAIVKGIEKEFEFKVRTTRRLKEI